MPDYKDIQHKKKYIDTLKVTNMTFGGRLISTLYLLSSREPTLCFFFFQIIMISKMNTVLFPLGYNGDLDVGFILDGSGSINDADPNNWERLLFFICDVISQLPEQGTQVGVVVFSQTAELRIKLNQYHQRDMLLDAVKQLTYPGSQTYTARGLYVARTQMFIDHNGDRVNAPNVAVLITDGESTIDTENTIPNAQALHRDGIRVICVGIGDRISEEEISAISSPSHERDVDYFLRKTFDFPESFISIFVESIEQREVEMTTAIETFSGENKGEYNWCYVDYFVEPQISATQIFETYTTNVPTSIEAVHKRSCNATTNLTLTLR